MPSFRLRLRLVLQLCLFFVVVPSVARAGHSAAPAQTNPIKRIALHATSLRFIHPVTHKEMFFQSPLPGDLGRLV